MQNVVAYVAVGSNIDEEIHIPSAFSSLINQVRVNDVSTHYSTKPLDGRDDQRLYVNGVWCLETAMPPWDLISLLKSIENQEGRTRSIDRFAPRTLDLDLILYGSLILEELNIPDKDVLKRPFVFKPLLELDYHLVWPPTGRSLALEVDFEDVVSLEPDWDTTRVLKNILNDRNEGQNNG